MFFISRVRPVPRYLAPPLARAHRVNHAEPWTWEMMEALNFVLFCGSQFEFTGVRFLCADFAGYVTVD